MKLMFFKTFMDRYNLFNLVDHFHSRGLYRTIFLRYETFPIYCPAWSLHIFTISYIIIYLNDGLSHLHSIMEGEESLRQYSPEVKVQDPNNRNAVSMLPPIILFHGTADYSIPSDSRSESHLINTRSHDFSSLSIKVEG